MRLKPELPVDPHNHILTLHEKLKKEHTLKNVQTLLITYEPQPPDYDYRAYITFQGKIGQTVLRHQRVCSWDPEVRLDR